MQSGFGVESVNSMGDDGDNPLKPGHLILLDAPNLGLDWRISPFLYQKEGRIGKFRRREFLYSNDVLIHLFSRFNSNIITILI